jgi:hypothetical protein
MWVRTGKPPDVARARSERPFSECVRIDPPAGLSTRFTRNHCWAERRNLKLLTRVTLLAAANVGFHFEA